jgi:uncharacterized membrane protein (DUF4010 family)
MDFTPDLDTFRNFALALLIGALVGIDREKHQVEEGSQGIGGLRTFILFATVGALAGWLSEQLDTPGIFIATLVSVSAGVFVAYLVHARAKPGEGGMTTELAAIAVLLLGGVAMLGHSGLSVALAIVVSVVLAYKQPLHGLVERIGRADLLAGLRLLVATFIVLPLLPDRTIDPWGTLNPYKLWLLVILIAGLSLAGYVATRWLGSGRGTAITGLTGGLVSSTAVTLAFARRSRAETAERDSALLACGILIAWTVMFVRVMVEVAVVHPALLGALMVPFGTMGVAALLLAGFFYLRRQRVVRKPGDAGDEADVPLSNPFSLTSAARFAALFAVVLMVVALVQKYFPGQGLLLVAAIAGLTDVDAITLSMAEYAKGGGGAGTAASAIVIASLSNTVVKTGMVAVLGGRDLRRLILVAGAVIVAVGLAVLLVHGAAPARG